MDQELLHPDLHDRNRIFVNPNLATQALINELGVELAWDLCLDPAVDMAQETPRTLYHLLQEVFIPGFVDGRNR